jgi:aryl-alcohol dehydrogenase-like predicted oxidoreductase
MTVLATNPEASSALPVQRLGVTDMHITRVGFGAWAVGGADWAVGWGKQDDSASIASIRHAVHRGINWIDTAAVYGLGHSEEIVRQALAGMPVSERPYVFTKCGLIWDEADRMAPPKKVGTPSSIRREAATSLRRLGMERVDLCQMHVATVELPWCRAHKTGVIVYSPMASGLLTGAFTIERAKSLPEDDWRSRSADFTGNGLVRNLTVAKAIQPIAARHGTSVASVAVAWTLAWPAVTAAIVGARSPAQVDGWLDAATLRLTPEDLQEIAAAIDATGAGSGPSHPQL